MFDKISSIGGVFLAVVVLLVLLAVSPFLFISCINSLAEAGGSNFYIEHSFSNYVFSFVLILLVRGGS